MRVTDGGADELKTTFLQVFTQRVGNFSLGRDGLQSSPTVDFGFPVNKFPYVLVEGPEFLLHFQEGFCVFLFRPNFLFYSD